MDGEVVGIVDAATVDGEVVDTASATVDDEVVDAVASEVKEVRN